MKKAFLLMSFLAVGPLAASLSAGTLDVSAQISSQPDGSNFDYTIKLSNSSSSTDSLETFWFGWVPGKDFLPSNPISVTPPTGWADQVTHGGAGDGYAIQFVTSTTPLGPGDSLNFKFTSADSPAQLAANSPFYTGFPALTSFVYQGQPFQGDSERFIVLQSVPEPATLTMGITALVGAFAVSRARRAIARRAESRTVRAVR